VTLHVKLLSADDEQNVLTAILWGHSLRQRCLARKMRNTLDKLPRDAQVEIKRRLRYVFYTPSLEMAQERAAEVLAHYRETYPAAMRSFNDDLQACLVYLRLI